MKRNKKPILRLPPDYLGLIVVIIYVVLVLSVMGTPLSANDGNRDRIPLTETDRLLYAGIVSVFLLSHYEIYDDHIAFCWLFLKLKRISFECVNNGMIFRHRIGEGKQLRQQIIYLAKNDFRFTHIPNPWEQKKYLQKHKRNLIKIMLPIGKEQQIIELLEKYINDKIIIAN